MALDPQRPLTQAFLRIWQVQQGLPQAAIFSIRQTTDGYIWLGTQTGLYRFDGVRFVEVKSGSAVSLSKLWIQDLCEDHEHNLWIATDDAGLIRLRDGMATQFGLTERLPSKNVRCLHVDRRGVIWAGTNDGLARFENGQFVVSRMEQGLPSNEIHAFGEAPDGTIWIATDGPAWCVWKDGRIMTPTMPGSVLDRGQVTTLLTGPDGVCWVGTTAGLVRWQGDQVRRFTRADGLPDDWIHCLAKGQDGSIWVGTKDGLSRLQGDRIESFRTRDGLSQSTVYTLCEDHEGSLWVGTKHGLNQFSDRRTLPFTTSEGLPSNDTGPVLQDKSGNVWVGTLDAGLARFDGRQFSIAANVRQGLPSNTVLSLEDGGDHSLWIGTDKGLSRLQDGEVTGTFTTAQGLPSNIVRAVCRDHTGALWAGTTGGIAEYRDGRFIPPTGHATLLRKPVQALVAERGGYLTVATEGGGLCRLANRQLSHFTDRAPVSRNVDAFFVDQDNLLWSSQRGRGLVLTDKNHSHPITVKDGLYDDDISGIVADDEDRLWMGCSRGIFSVQRSELRRFAAGEILRVTSLPFSPTDAQRTIECRQGVQPAVWKMKDGCVWFSTIRGVLVIDPRRLLRKLPVPSVLVEEVRVNGQEQSAQRIGSLPPGRNNLEFHYTALSFAVPSRIKFEYKLEGFDPDWVSAGARREAFYTNLVPGNYRFRVKAVNLDDVATEAALPVTFTLEPHFYQTRWFIPLLAGGVAFLGWLALQLRIRQFKAQLQAVLAERSRIARELHDTLIQGFSGVTMQMQALTTRIGPSAERDTLTDIIHDAGDCLSEARRSVAGLRHPQGTESGLVAALSLTARQLTESRDMRLRLNLSNTPLNLEPDVEYNILRIAQEAILNAVKHAGASTVEVTLTATQQSLTLTIHDDGCGLDPVHLEHVQPGHYGLVGMRERAAQIGAELIWHCEPRQGTTVRLIRPHELSVAPTATPNLLPSVSSEVEATR